MKGFVAFVVGVAVVALASACSSPVCGASCSGCCDARGQCRVATDSSACGRGGAMCAACGLGQSCVAGACMTTGSGGFSGGVSGTGGGTSGTGGGTSGGGMSGGGMSGGGTSGTGGGMTAGGTSGTGGGAGGPDCSIVGVQVPTGGCTLNLVAPTNCQVVSLTNGFVELDWTTNTTFCEGPHKLYVAGSPVSTWTSGNVLQYSLTSGQYSNYAMTRNIGGYYLLTAQELAQLQAVNGQYYFRVEGFSGSLSEVNTFIVR